MSLVRVGDAPKVAEEIGEEEVKEREGEYGREEEEDEEG